MNYWYILNGIFQSVSGSILFLVSRDLFKYYFCKVTPTQRPLLNLKQYNNLGLYLGLGLGLFNSYMQQPVITFLLS